MIMGVSDGGNAPAARFDIAIRIVVTYGVQMTKRAALYLRVSTAEQTTENQERDLRSAAQRAGWEIVHVYCDHGISGAKGRDARAQFDALCKDAARRKFDVVMAWHVDRIGRSLKDLIAFLDDLHAVRVDLYLHQQGVDTTTPSGKAMFQMLGVFAEFERSMIRDRVMAGLARARAQGKRPGPALDPVKVEHARTLLAGGMGILKAAKTAGLGTSTVQRLAKS